ncbi:ribosomal protein S2 [Eremomyces bilateralis CBS 781.70]|uniref:Ribosomal protein S2 n=1 Tax=Eremomyces bilateralis CBS 781.70 TaxID=1392243 RepID=A0A6G1FS68_9PEZI|nr:ribosomal protein S2 [Eremomyces bilateralis CBS 781.70]KAF1808512.1 ribosomal protein S2 [Eremomyces bilateralis CBS 781.70]
MISRRLILRQGRRALSQPFNTQYRAYTRVQTSTRDNAGLEGENEVDAVKQFFERQSAALAASQPSASPTQSNEVDVKDAEDTGDTANYYHLARHQKKSNTQFGSAQDPFYKPRELITNPPKPEDITLELLLASQSHLGHKTSLWNPANSRYIFGIRDGIHIISLEVTAAFLRRAAKLVSAVTEAGGLVLFVGTRAGQDRCVVKAAELSGGCHLFERWTPGGITNGTHILGQCKTKVVDEHEQELPGYQNQLSQRAALKPDLVVCLNPLENYVLLHECALDNIPTIGIIDTDANPAWVTYPIPANDDSLRCVQVIGGVLGRAGEAGKQRRLAAAKEGYLTYQPKQQLKKPTFADLAQEKLHVEADLPPALPPAPTPASHASSDGEHLVQ